MTDQDGWGSKLGIKILKLKRFLFTSYCIYFSQLYLCLIANVVFINKFVSFFVELPNDTAANKQGPVF